MIGEGGIDDNVLVETNANQNTSTEVNMMSSGAAVTRDGANTIVDAIVVHHIHQTASMPSSERGGTLVDVSSLAWPPRPECHLLQSTIVPPEVEPIHRDMEAGRTSIRTRATII